MPTMPENHTTQKHQKYNIFCLFRDRLAFDEVWQVRFETDNVARLAQQVVNVIHRLSINELDLVGRRLVSSR